jgi:hypothetical protein
MLAGLDQFLQLESALQQAGLDPATTQALPDVNEQSRVDGLRAALALLVTIAVVGLFFTRAIPQQASASMGISCSNARQTPADPGCLKRCTAAGEAAV